ncbi:hypothetical protein TTHERM_00954040 (macronuclear) [Tetrahymena thermophila SB210]|uniref:Uncharacterized protein n=1 Tax=Tetrahymena thermophila (strain SB210) TaxID=312017 RepID=Q23MR0_TETTS|nr:hypothetical protein TTHERM_00954040 [Tetrahymena thermophila SB210]EAR97782.1 hypothetical protein TTHERM_00954040 [Tetrahymena thermophila SB210]|eukprot:XP_001018027.1 hypothetical protein TTHERM_00954040 [Tetrahymena thermophila SB210]
MTSIQKEREIISAYHKNKKDTVLKNFALELFQPNRNIIQEQQVMNQIDLRIKQYSIEVSQILGDDPKKNQQSNEQNAQIYNKIQSELDQLANHHSYSQPDKINHQNQDFQNRNYQRYNSDQNQQNKLKNEQILSQLQNVKDEKQLLYYWPQLIQILRQQEQRINELENKSNINNMNTIYK